MSDAEAPSRRRREGQEKLTRRQLRNLLEASRKKVSMLQLSAVDTNICAKCGERITGIRAPPPRMESQIPPLLLQGYGCVQTV